MTFSEVFLESTEMNGWSALIDFFSSLFAHPVLPLYIAIKYNTHSVICKMNTSNIYPRSQILIRAASNNLTTRTKSSAAIVLVPQPPFILSAPINCPPPINCPQSPASSAEENEENEMFYNAKTWNMYNRITKYRKGHNKNKNSPFLLPHQRVGSIRENPRQRGEREAQATTNSALDEIFCMEM